MKKLEEYEILKTVFYKGEYILKYICRHPSMSDLDKAAVKATIMNALVYGKCIFPDKEFLDLDTLEITNDQQKYHYEEYPFVTGYPLWLKEVLRKHIIRQSGSIPISVHAARPFGRVTYCIYDANTVLSVCFDEFAFLEASYDSPTRPGVRVEGRPFLEVKMGERMYLVDTLTKRFFEEEEFARRYRLEVTYRIRNTEFTSSQKEIYKEQTEDARDGYGTFLAFTIPMLETFHGIPKMEEYLYEVEESKKIFPDSWKKAEVYMVECASLMPPDLPKEYMKEKKGETN